MYKAEYIVHFKMALLFLSKRKYRFIKSFCIYYIAAFRIIVFAESYGEVSPKRRTLIKESLCFK